MRNSWGSYWGENGFAKVMMHKVRVKFETRKFYTHKYNYHVLYMCMHACTRFTLAQLTCCYGERATTMLCLSVCMRKQYILYGSVFVCLYY